MPKFFYLARDSSGRKVTGLEEAINQEELVVRLQAKDLFVVDVALESKESSVALKQESSLVQPKRRHYRVSSGDLALFCRQLSTMLGAGVTILKSLDIISQQVASVRLYKIIHDLQKRMEAGLSLHESMSKHPEVFSELWVNLVESGEASGNLALVLNRLAGYLERNAAFRSKVVSALIYPVILMLAGTGALLFLTIKIIPTFAELFSGFNLKLPVLTQMLVAISVFFRKYILIIVGLIMFGFFVFKSYTKTKAGLRNYEKFKFRIPVFGEFFRAILVERFASGMSTLVESGVPILYSLEISEHSVGSIVMADVIRKIKDDIRDGKSLSEPLGKSGFFEPMVVQMVGIGEEIGELSQMFKRIDTFYQEYVETFLARFTSLFEPIMLIFMGLVIGLMVIGMFLPIFQIAQVGRVG
jgi:type II secretory pathway component PulF